MASPTDVYVHDKKNGQILHVLACKVSTLDADDVSAETMRLLGNSGYG
jgi:hypothetical protein